MPLPEQLLPADSGGGAAWRVLTAKGKHGKTSNFYLLEQIYHFVVFTQAFFVSGRNAKCEMLMV